MISTIPERSPLVDEVTVTQATGIFSPCIQGGNVLAGHALWTVNNVLLFTLGRVHIHDYECVYIRPQLGTVRTRYR